MLTAHCLLVFHGRPRLIENTLKHRLGKLAGKRVLLARVIRTNQPDAIRQKDHHAVPELGTGPRNRTAVFLVRRKKRIEGDLAERNHDPGLLEQVELANQIRPTPFKFNNTGLISGRSATHRRGNVTILKFLAILAIIRVRLTRKASAMERSIEPIAATVTGKHSTRAISTVGCGSKPNDQYSGHWVTKSGQRFCPIVVAQKTPRRILGAGFPPANQTRAAPAVDDGVIEFAEAFHSNGRLAA